MNLRPLLLALLLPGLGCKPMLYPLARAFGGPSESELKLRRAAFERLKARQGTARLRVSPVLDPRRDGSLEGSAAPLVDALKAAGWAGASALPAAPSVAPLPMGRNQLRYLQARARSYAAWAREASLDGDYLLVVEVLAGRDGVGGVHCYLVESGGQVAYLHLQNSHHFGIDRPADAMSAARRALGVLARDLQRRPEQLYPRWGVG